MHSVKPSGVWALTAGMGFLAALGAFAYAYLNIENLDPQCFGQSLPQCRDFVPWIWTGLFFLILSAIAVVIAVRKKQKPTFLAVIILLALLLAGIGIFLWARSAKNDQLMGTKNLFENTLPLSKNIRKTEPKSSLALAHVGAKHPFQELPRNRLGLALDDDPFLATSKKEQAWLDRNGYPNVKQWETYGQASDAQLAEAARAGDKSAAILLDQRLLMAGDDTKIESLLTEGARGSGFALDILAAYLANGDSGGRITAYAVSRVSEMRGNLRLATARDMMFNKPFSASDRMEGEMEAIELYKTLYKLQKKLVGPNATPVDPRPIDG